MGTRSLSGRPDWRVVLALGISAIAGYYLLPSAGVAQAIVLVVVNGFAAAWALRTASRVEGRARVVWAALGAGIAFSAFANLIYYGYPLHAGGPLPFLSPVDALWVMTYPCFFVALLSLAKLRRADDYFGNLIEAGIVVTSAGMILWSFVLDPAADASGLSAFARVISVAYPAMDVVLFAVVVRLLSASRGNGNAAMTLLVTGFLALLASDTTYAVQLAHGAYHYGGPIDGMWMLSYLLIGVAALHPSACSLATAARPGAPRIRAGRLAFLAAALCVGPVLLVADGRDRVLMAVLCVITFLLVLARMAVVNWRLVAAGKAVDDKTDELRHQALHDALTGLPNRTLLMDRIRRVQARSRRTGTTTSVLLIDLDGFKNVNDTLGQDAGDQLLAAVAERLTIALREVDTVARLGGDEFAVVIDEQTVGFAPELVAERILRVMREPFEVSGSRLPIAITVSVGIAVGPRDTPDDLLRDADVARHQAKASGRDRFAVFEPDAAAQRRHEIELDLRRALAHNQFELRYQPIHEFRHLDLVGFEALLRWRHPSHGLVGPDEFIPVLEASGNIVEVGHWVLREACRQTAAWHSTGSTCGISVNVSGRQLDHDCIIDHVADALQISGLAPHLLTLEITETALMGNPDATAGRLRELKKLGVHIAVDDFGTGYSSLAYLQRFPVDCLKIDRVFTDAISRSPESRALMHTLVQLGTRSRSHDHRRGRRDGRPARLRSRRERGRGPGFPVRRAADGRLHRSQHLLANGLAS